MTQLRSVFHITGCTEEPAASSYKNQVASRVGPPTFTPALGNERVNIALWITDLHAWEVALYETQSESWVSLPDRVPGDSRMFWNSEGCGSSLPVSVPSQPTEPSSSVSIIIIVRHWALCPITGRTGEPVLGGVSVGHLTEPG